MSPGSTTTSASSSSSGRPVRADRGRIAGPPLHDLLDELDLEPVRCLGGQRLGDPLGAVADDDDDPVEVELGQRVEDVRAPSGARTAGAGAWGAPSASASPRRRPGRWRGAVLSRSCPILPETASGCSRIRPSTGGDGPAVALWACAPGGSRPGRSGLHVTLAVLVAGCAALCDWQVHRALSGNGLSWAYVFEWPFFAGYGVYMWWKLLHDRPALVPTIGVDSHPEEPPAPRTRSTRS